MQRDVNVLEKLGAGENIVRDCCTESDESRLLLEFKHVEDRGSGSRKTSFIFSCFT